MKATVNELHVFIYFLRNLNDASKVNKHLRIGTNNMQLSQPY